MTAASARLVTLTDRHRLAAFLRRRAELHLYEIGDLDDLFWLRSTFYGLVDHRDELQAVALLYDGGDPPTLVALAADEEERGALSTLLRELGSILPGRVYAHLSPRVHAAIDPSYVRETRGVHDKLVWTHRGAIRGIDTAGVEPLGPDHVREVVAFLDANYPGNFFHPRVLRTGAAFGLRDGGVLVCFAGVHVHSEEYRVAALGNVATAATHRGRGLARRACAALLRALEARVDVVGLNVDADNEPALRCYRGLGFTFAARYEMILARA